MNLGQNHQMGLIWAQFSRNLWQLPPDLFNLLAASSGIGFPAVRGADNEEAGIGKLRISEML